MTTKLQIGDKAPNFQIETTDGMRSLKDFAGRHLVLYFYPKDDTPGCTKEAIAFTEFASEFDEASASILGISKDTLAKHEKFKEKHQLSIPLGSDQSGELCEAYGVWVEKKMYGKTYMGIERATFLVDPTGKIAQIWRKVKVSGHVKAVLDTLRGIPA